MSFEYIGTVEGSKSPWLWNKDATLAVQIDYAGERIDQYRIPWGSNISKEEVLNLIEAYVQARPKMLGGDVR